MLRKVETEVLKLRDQLEAKGMDEVCVANIFCCVVSPLGVVICLLCLSTFCVCALSRLSWASCLLIVLRPSC